MAACSKTRVLIYALRRDLRLSDNPIFDQICVQHQSGEANFTHILPLYVFPAQQIEVSGFIPQNADPEVNQKSPFPEARSRLSGLWRCGPNRAKFQAECVWDLKQSLLGIDSDLVIRVGMLVDVVADIIQSIESEPDQGVTVSGLWMAADEGSEEEKEHEAVEELLTSQGKLFRLFQDEKYFVDDRDLPFDTITDVPDIYTDFCKKLEPLRTCPRPPLGKPKELPPALESTFIPPQAGPFTIPNSLSEILDCLMRPLASRPDLAEPPTWLSGSGSEKRQTRSGYPFVGGETAGLARIDHVLIEGVVQGYKDTQNVLVGPNNTTRLGAYLAFGCITSRQVHSKIMSFENGDSNIELTSHPFVSSEEKLEKWKGAVGFGKGESTGTAKVRTQLLWRDFFRLTGRKHGTKLFQISGVRGSSEKQWRRLDDGNLDEVNRVRTIYQRFCSGSTGISLIDASQREVYLTGDTNNRTRQNVAYWLAKHLHIDWRLGAEWYEYTLVDYDVSSNWANWQYVAGVGNDPKDGRNLNPIKQALDFDKEGIYIKRWISELRGLNIHVEGTPNTIDNEKQMGLFQPWKLSEADQNILGLTDADFVKNPLMKISFSVNKPRVEGTKRRGQFHKTKNTVGSSSREEGSRFRGQGFNRRGLQREAGQERRSDRVDRNETAEEPEVDVRTTNGKTG